MRVNRTFLISCLALVAIQPAQAQNIEDLRPADGRLDVEFSTITGLVEFPSGDVLIADAIERSLYRANFDKGSVVPIARRGSGPREFQSVGRLLHWRGDSAALVDRAGDRLLILSARSEPVRIVRHSDLLGWADDPPSSADIRFIDRAGRVFVQSAEVVRVRRGETAPTHGPVLRYDPATRRVDTLAQLRLSGLVQRELDGRFGLSLADLANPFRLQDAWVTLPDGQIAIVRGKPYRVEWRLGTAHYVGPEVPTRAIPVTEADRLAVSEEGVSVGGNMIPVPMSSLDGLPDAKPPFDARSVIADPTGGVWVLRFGAAADSHPVYDVFGADGRLARRIRLGAGCRVTALSHVSAYVSCVDEDGLHHLSRHPRSNIGWSGG
jgi:hypothetical protein